MNHQETFDFVVAHCAKQRQRSYIKGEGCRVRDDRGRSCAIGCLIPNKKYDRSLESFSELTRRSIELGLNPKFWKNDSIQTFGFYDALRSAHDYSKNTLQIQDKFYDIAKKYNLNSEAVEMITSWVM